MNSPWVDADPDLQFVVGPDNPDLANKTVLMTHIGEGRDLPPFLVIHGSADRLVPFGQSIMLVEALREAGQDVTFYKIAGADHGDPTFWRPATLDLVVDGCIRLVGNAFRVAQPAVQVLTDDDPQLRQSVG